MRVKLYLRLLFRVVYSCPKGEHIRSIGSYVQQNASVFTDPKRFLTRDRSNPSTEIGELERGIQEVIKKCLGDIDKLKKEQGWYLY
jgi:hypothetical protein